MSLNVGDKNSKYVAVSNVTMRYAFSEKVLFADLRTSKKTGANKFDKETGEIITDAQGNPVPERVYTHWEARFVGNAFEPAKALKNGQFIDVVNGWIDKEERTKGGQTYTNVYVVITDFTLSNIENNDDDDEPPVEAVEGDNSVSDAYRALNGDDNTPTGGGRG